MSAVYVCPGEWIATVGRQALLPLLMPYDAFFRKEGLDLAKYDWKQDHIPIHNVILRAKQLPKAMRDMLIEVVELSSKEAQAVFVEVAAENGWNLGDTKWLSPATIAARAYVERPHLFEHVVAQVAVRKTHDWVDFFDARHGDLEERVTKESRARLVERLRAHWAQRERGRFVEVKEYEIDGVFTFVITHADLPRVHLSIDEGDTQRELVRIRPERTDLVQFFPDQGRMSLHTRWSADVEALRTIWGEVFWTEEDRYRRYEAYTSEPLLKLGSEALRHVAERDMEVRVKEVTFAAPGRKGERMTAHYPRTGPDLDSYIEFATKRGLSTISTLALSFRSVGQRHPLTVVIKADNRIGLLRHQHRSNNAFHFLLQKGFALPPPKRASR